MGYAVLVSNRGHAHYERTRARLSPESKLDLAPGLLEGDGGQTANRLLHGSGSRQLTSGNGAHGRLIPFLDGAAVLPGLRESQQTNAFERVGVMIELRRRLPEQLGALLGGPRPLCKQL